MKFSTKVFLTVFGVSALSSIGICLLVYTTVSDQERQQFLGTHQLQLQMIKDTLLQLESASDLIARNAALIIKEKDRQHGLASNSSLSATARALNVAHIFITDRHGHFIRSTNGDVDLFKNTLFDYCPGYRGLIEGNLSIEQTPIIPSSDEATSGPFKYTMIPNFNRSRVLEVSVSLDFIAQTLAKAVQANKDILEIGLYSPNGNPLGIVTGRGAARSISVDPIMLTESGPKWDTSDVSFAQRVNSDIKNCCECVTKNITDPKHLYFYILTARVSAGQLFASFAGLRHRILLIFFAMLALSFVVSRKISNQLLKRLQTIKAGVSKIAEENSLSVRLDIEGSDEIAKLAQQINRMTFNLERGQRNLIDSEQKNILARIAAQLAHDIRSPIAALNVAIYDSSSSNEEKENLIRTAVNRIKDIANSLLERYRDVNSIESPQAFVSTLSRESRVTALAPELIASILSEKKLQYKQRQDVKINSEIESTALNTFISIQPCEFRRVLSNLIDNAAEAISTAGQIVLHLSNDETSVRIDVSDNGKGIPTDVLATLNVSPKSYCKPNGTGLGLSHAMAVITSFGGNLSLWSQENTGTTATIMLPRAPKPPYLLDRLTIRHDSSIIILDDDSTVHRLWATRFRDLRHVCRKLTLYHFFNANEFRKAASSMTQHGSAIFLIDMELQRDTETGLDLIQEFILQKRSVLVTAKYDDQALQSDCLQINLKILPKSLIGQIPIEIHDLSSGLCTSFVGDELTAIERTHPHFPPARSPLL